VTFLEELIVNKFAFKKDGNKYLVNETEGLGKFLNIFIRYTIY